MKITLHEISVRDLSDGFIDKNEEGVFGYKGNLDIRPAYQRELKNRLGLVKTQTLCTFELG